MTAARTTRSALVMVVLLAALVPSALIGVTLGAEPLPLATVADVVAARFTGAAVSPGLDTIVWELRMPRTLLAIIVGAGLALAGAAMQTLVSNPLADPYLLGISSGASVGAVAVLTTGFLAGAGTWALSGGALLGALAAGAIVLTVVLASGGITPLRLILTGTVLAAAFSSIASFLVFRSKDPSAAESAMFWLLGSFAGADRTKLLAPAIVVAIGAIALLAVAGWLDALMLGPTTAASLGVPVPQLRLALVIVLALVVSVLVAVSGGIGFVGLVVPHLARLLVGPRHRALLPTAMLAGALFMVWVDLGTRVLTRPVEIPVSVLTGIIGAPVFLILMSRRRYSFAGTT